MNIWNGHFPITLQNHLPGTDCRMDLRVQRHRASLLDDMESWLGESWHSVCFWFSAWVWIHPTTTELAPSVPDSVEVYIHKKQRLFLSPLVAFLWQRHSTRALRLHCHSMTWWKNTYCFSTWLFLIFYLLHCWCLLISKQMNKQQAVSLE